MLLRTSNEVVYKVEQLHLMIFYIFLSLLIATATANIVLIGNNASLSFDDIEANFARSIKGSGECGILYLAEPLDACSPLTNKVVPAKGASSPFALIVRGGCTFKDKVKRAQIAGFKAAIVYDNEDSGVLVAMAGSSTGIKIHAVFVSKASGEVLKNYTGFNSMELWLIPTFQNSAWSIMAISFMSLFVMSAVLATCFFIRRHHVRREWPRAPRAREFHGMSSRLVKAIPSLIFTAVLEDNCTSGMCAICLEDYSVGEKLRVLPCHHKFHAICVDCWLTMWRTFCPVCKRDVRISTGSPPASECTPLLSSDPASPSSSASLSSVLSSLAASSAIQIVPASSQSPPVSDGHSLSSTHMFQSLRPYRNSRLSRSSVDHWNGSSQRSHASNLLSSPSLGYPSVSPLNSTYLSLHVPSALQ